jgi:hypothetical protein
LQEKIRVIWELIRETMLIKFGIDPTWLRSHRLGDQDTNEWKERVPQANTPIAVMVDGSTDSACLDQQIVFGRCVVDGKMETHLLGVAPSKNGGSEAITNVVWQIVDQCHIDRNRIFFLGTDGASSMIGENSGVGARMQHELPFLIQNHCVDHR